MASRRIRKATTNQEVAPAKRTRSTKASASSRIQGSARSRATDLDTIENADDISPVSEQHSPGRGSRQTASNDESPPSSVENVNVIVTEEPLTNNQGTNSEWSNSTVLPSAQRNVNYEPIDYTARFVNVLERTLDTVRETSLGERNSRLINRLTTAKSLPIFSGDPLEWLHFKEAYELSKEIGEYSDRENISRLFESLKGEAREVVNTLLATSRDANEIIRTLELHYGNKQAIADKIVTDLKNLPSIDSGKISLIQFATKLRNATVAIKSLNLTGYLHGHELIRVIGVKLPSELKYSYNRHVATVTEDKTELEKLSEFLYREAELASKAGIFSFDLSRDSNNQRPRKEARPTRSGVVFAVNHVEPKEKRIEKSYIQNRGCVICKQGNHRLWDCKHFINETIDKRWSLVKKLRLCFCCLKPNHSRNDCTNVKCSVCSLRHHVLLHYSNRSSINGQSKSAQEQSSINASVSAGTVDTFALLDEGSTITLVHKEIAKVVGLRGKQVDLKLTGFQNEVLMTDCQKINFEIIGTFGKKEIKYAVAADELTLPTQTISENLVNSLGHLANDLNLSPYYNAKAKILIGQDNWRLIATRELREIENIDIAISRTQLGWAIHGPARQISMPSHRVFVLSESQSERDAVRPPGAEIITSDEESLDNMIRHYFDLESLGVTANIRSRSNHDRSYKILDETSERMGNSWETGLLWKDDNPPAVDSRGTALNRLFNLEKRLDRDPTYANLYYREMQRFIDLGYAVKVDKAKQKLRVWYLPHFGVFNINKPDRVRLVFDAAAKTNGISLNDQLESGPDLLRSLPGILIRFRQEPIAIKADISDMFLRVYTREEDRGAQRFLWRGKERDGEPEEYEMTRLIFGSKSSPCSAIYIKNKNASRFSETLPEASESIILDSYMDDFLTSRKTEKEASQLVRDVIKINSEAGFEMHGWGSNNANIFGQSTMKENSAKGREMRLCDGSKERVLGLFWDIQTDELKFNVGFAKIAKEIIDGNRKPTKREVLRVVMSIFDPLGLLAPFALKSKLLMQSIHRSGINWDDKLRDEEFDIWLSWLEKLDCLKECRIPRCFSPSDMNSEKIQLHIFCDASLSAFSSAAYLRFESPDNKVHVALIMAKSRVAPLKPLSVPRLELQAALLGARLASYLKDEIKIKLDRRFFWSDSATVIQWIRSEPRTRQIFVAHRLGEIAELSSSSEWRWVSTDQNPADDATRFTNNAIYNNSRWFEGPEFLKNPENEWPKEKSLNRNEKSAIDNLEMRKAFVFTVTLNSTDIPLELRLLGWNGLIIYAQRLSRFFDRWRHVSDTIPPLDSIRKSEKYWYRIIQFDCFQSEINSLKNGKEISKGSRIASLKPFLDEFGILRANGRGVLVSEKNYNNQPIILDSKHYATKFLIKEYHRKFHHGSSDAVVNELRQEYYIVGLRGALRSLISRCLICRLRRAKPQSPMMSALPAGRVAFRQRPFSHCGIDYFGPMMVKIGRRREKRWGVLFTCLTTRAIHLELAHSLSTSSAIMAIERLSARRATPLVIYSDNGTNFRGASRELKELILQLDQDKISETALQKRIVWRFNPPDAPHMGGAWERLIRSVKVALYAILSDQAPNEEVLQTVLVEIEHSVNSRPLTHVSLDPRDNEALTPNHFLFGTSSGAIELGVYDYKNVNLKNQWRLAQHFADAFWKRWLREYLPNLLPRKKWAESGKSLQVGDIVLIVDLQSPRNCWKKGEIIQVHPGKDGEVRVAEVQTSMGNFTRPTRKLIKLLGIDEVQN